MSTPRPKAAPAGWDANDQACLEAWLSLTGGADPEPGYDLEARALSAIENYLGQSLKVSELKFIGEANLGPIYPPARPIVAVLGLKIAGQVVDPARVEIDPRLRHRIMYLDPFGIRNNWHGQIDLDYRAGFDPFPRWLSDLVGEVMAAIGAKAGTGAASAAPFVTRRAVDGVYSESYAEPRSGDQAAGFFQLPPNVLEVLDAMRARL